jgi:Ca-activated chloride channel family protein
MTLLSPGHLWLLVVVGLLVAVYLVLQRRGRHSAVRFPNLDLLGTVAPNHPGWRRHMTAALACLALVGLIVGLARPSRAESVPREEAIVMLVIDVSNSMTATDVAPSRLLSAEKEATAFVQNMPPGFQVGLVSFDDTVHVLATPTVDHNAVIASIRALQTGHGTATGDGLVAALDAIAATQTDATSTDDLAATIVLLSDGASTAGVDPVDAAGQAKDANVPVNTILYGTADGTIESNGQTVDVPADGASLEAVANASDGTYFEAATPEQLRAVYDDIQTRVGTVVEQRELVVWFLGAALLALALGLTTSMVWSPRFV